MSPRLPSSRWCHLLQVVGRKHGRAALDAMEEGEDEEDRHYHQVRMTDSAGLSFVVSKNTSHLVGANQSIFMRTLKLLMLHAVVV